MIVLSFTLPNLYKSYSHLKEVKCVTSYLLYNDEILMFHRNNINQQHPMLYRYFAITTRPVVTLRQCSFAHIVQYLIIA